MQTKIKAILITISFFSIIFSGFLGTLGINVSYFDEFLGICSLIIITLKRKLNRRALGVIYISVFFSFYVIFTSLFSIYFRGFFLSLADIFLFLKPLLILIGIYHISDKTKDVALGYIFSFSILIIISAFLLLPLNYISDIFEPFDVRFNIPSYSFIFSNPGEYLNVIILCFISVLSIGKERISGVLLKFLASILILSALRFKGFVMLLFIISIVKYFNLTEVDNKIFKVKNITKVVPKRILIPIVLIAAVPGWVQFQSYFIDQLTPRSFLVINSVNIFMDYFPLGSGAGTYGSAIAKMFYSPVYETLGFDERWGLSKEEPLFLNDSFWPLVLAQYGFIGVILVFLLYKNAIKLVLGSIIPSVGSYSSFFVVLASLFLSTLGSSLLIGNLGSAYMIILALITSFGNKVK